VEGSYVLEADLPGFETFHENLALNGQAGRLFKPLAYTKTFAMAFAALVSITLAPALMSVFVKGQPFGMIYADGGALRTQLGERDYSAFKNLCVAANEALERIAA